MSEEIKVDRRKFNKLHSKMVPWKPGQSGNPKGRPKKDVCITNLVREYLDGVSEDPDNKKNRISRGEAVAKTLYECARRGDVTAIKLLMNYIDGLPVQKVEVKKTEDVPEYDLSILSKEELNAYEKLIVKMSQQRAQSETNQS